MISSAFLALMRLAFWVCSTIFGSLGVFLLWGSFYVPSLAREALVFLGAAIGMTLAAPAIRRD